MIIKDYRDIKWLTHRAMFSAMRDAGETVNPEEAAHEMEVLIRHAKKNASDYRDCRASFRHHRPMNNRKQHYKELHAYLQKLESKYTNRSLVFQYMLEAVSCVKKTFDQVNDAYKRNPNAPAFDDSRRSPLSNLPDDVHDPELVKVANLGREMRRKFYKWIDNTDDPVIHQVKDILHNPREYKDSNGRTKIRPKKYALTRNGSVSGIYRYGEQLMDIEGQCFQPEFLSDKTFDAISDYFGVSNMSKEDDRLYIQIPDPYDDCAVVHMMVPDKDGKAREVYYLLPIISAVGKGIADILDPYMRKLPGIYTYDQQLWIEYVMEFKWNQTGGMIITVDMEKFSDTIYRRHFITLLYHLGIPKKVCNDLDDLYSLKVWDKILEKPLGVHNVILQGQYSIFMLMSLLNLCLQRYIVYVVDSKSINKMGVFVQRLLTAVLGDDTGMKFQNTDFDYAWKFINDMYGSMGMMINQLKSDKIINGVGQGDFAKTSFDRYGIIDHLNPKNVENKNIDGIINDILWLHKNNEYKRSMLTSLFDSEIADRIMDLSIINGGTNDRPIEVRDVDYLINNLQRFHLQYREMDELSEERVLNSIALEYRKIGSSLYYSPLYYYVPSNMRDELERLSTDQQDDMIKVFVLNANTIGMDPNYDMLKELVGKTPSHLHMEYVNSKLYSYESHDADLWINVRTYDQFVAKRKTEKKGRYSKLFLPLMDGSYVELYSPGIKIYPEQVSNIRNMAEYREKESMYKNNLKTKILMAERISIWQHTNWGIEHTYITLYSDNYRSSDTYRISWIQVESKYPQLTEKVYDSTIKPKLMKHGLNLDFSSFMETLNIGN